MAENVDENPILGAEIAENGNKLTPWCTVLLSKLEILPEADLTRRFE